MSFRSHLVPFIYILWFLAIILRLFYWQAIKTSDLRRQANLQYGGSVNLSAARGEILANDGLPLVSNREVYSLMVNLPKFNLSKFYSSGLSRLVNATESAKMLLQTPAPFSRWVVLSEGITPDNKKTIQSLNLKDIDFINALQPVYPEGSSSAYLTGFVGVDDLGQPKGYFGLEGYYDKTLTGKSGKIIRQQDALGRPIILSEELVMPNIPGSSLLTSIDRTLQYVAYQKLENGIQKYQADSGTISVMDSHSGQITAMVSIPGYDPSEYNDFSTSIYKNPIISEAYEPGSTFKVIVMSAALDAKVVTPNTICNICSGPVSISDDTVSSWDNHYYPNSDMRDVILHSDNVGMVFVSRKLGKDRMLDYIRKYGFGKPTGIDLQEESSPTLRDNNHWYDIDWATAAFGQGIAVTRIQMLTAVNAIANRGLLVRPSVVRSIITENKSKEIKNDTAQRIISSEAANQIIEMMNNGVNKGEVRYYKPAGFNNIAGKTGTAQIPIAGHYDKQKFIASFIGFAPIDDPKFTMLVTLKNPKTSPWGSTTAAPVWFDVARELFRYYRITPGGLSGL